jgi:hypothetical protein
VVLLAGGKGNIRLGNGNDKKFVVSQGVKGQPSRENGYGEHLGRQPTAHSLKWSNGIS